MWGKFVWEEKEFQLQNFNVAHTIGCELLRFMNQIQVSTVSDHFFCSLLCCGAYSILSLHESRLHSPWTPHTHSSIYSPWYRTPACIRPCLDILSQVSTLMCTVLVSRSVCGSHAILHPPTHSLCLKARGVSSGIDAAVLLVLCQKALLCWFNDWP